MVLVKAADRRSSVKISFPVKLENELRELAKEEEKTLSGIVNSLVEWALERRGNERLWDETYRQTRAARIMVDQMAVEQFGIEVHKQMVHEIAAVCRRDLKDLKS